MGFLHYLIQFMWTQEIFDAEPTPRVDRHPTHMSRGDAGRSGDSHIGIKTAQIANILSQSMRLARASSTSQKHIPPRLQNIQSFFLSHLLILSNFPLISRFDKASEQGVWGEGAGEE